MADKEILSEAKEAFKIAAEAEMENRAAGLDDLRFAKQPELYQWPPDVRKQREQDGRPCLTINRMPAFGRQVVNDCRQNKPAIKVRPWDSRADIETASVISGLIRNIENVSNADIAYDTAVESAVYNGFGYFRVSIDYTHDDSFDQELKIDRIANPFTVYGDPYSTAADSSDWMSAFVTNMLTKDQFIAAYQGANESNWDTAGYGGLETPWLDGDNVIVAEWWKRVEVDREILLLSDGSVVGADVYKEHKDIYDSESISVVKSRMTKGYKVTQHLMSGAEVLKTTDWAGHYIPIIPVYGDEVNIEGKRYFRSLIADAKDPQRMLNYWRTTATELVALAPKAPWVGHESAFGGDDSSKWATANSVSHAYLSVPDGVELPQRQPFAGVPAGALQEALNATDDMKAVIGLYDASLGAKSNETSGKAINARKVEGDISTFHFIDNLARGIRHGGRVLIDLIPYVYTGERIVRVLGEDGTAQNVQLGQKQMQPGQAPAAGAQSAESSPKNLSGVYDLSVGKYDLVVEAGPSYTTKRVEAAEQMAQLFQSFPQAAALLGDIYARNLDWPGADEIADRLKKMLPPQLQDEQQGMPPQAQAIIQQLTQQLQAMHEQLTANNADVAKTQVDHRKLDIEEQKLALEDRKAQAEIAKLDAEALQANAVTASSGVSLQVLQQVSALADAMSQSAAHISAALGQAKTPTAKIARKQPDGSWMMTEQPMGM